MAINVSKTREILVDAARQLFARMGFDNTTMNDIAQASHKGRRTLYTYFKSKDDVLLAVIKTEMDELYQVLFTLVAQEIPADEKLIKFLHTRLVTIKKIVSRNGTLKAAFFRDMWRVETARKEYNKQEINLIKKILDEGVEAGLFEIHDTYSIAYILHQSLKGLDSPYIRGKIGNTAADREAQQQNLINLIFNGIKKQTDINQ
ncbi:MAG: TetR/AcrR family transcriptional regulator [Tannerella sp.]|jgi:AcrR family transcriptional regulator|nr:TetR/AcrR family transcriptional regulator [Tannerella sp.]